MIEFRDLKLEDKCWIDELLQYRQHLSCEYCFGNHYIWKRTYGAQVARINDYYTLMMKNDDNETKPSFLFPAGKGELKPAILEMIDYCKENDLDFEMHSALKEDIEELERLFPGKFEFHCDRDYSEYIYNVEDLINLAGKKYHGKRNHIARFKDQDWAFEPITDANMQECLEMNYEWCKENDCGRDEGLKEEFCAVRAGFRYFTELGFFGGILRQNGKIVAFSIGERLSNETVVVHIEKAFSDVQGAYPTINREFLANMCSEYKYVNREEDLGLEGLRKAKLSYHPYILLDKYSVRLSDGNKTSD